MQGNDLVFLADAESTELWTRVTNLTCSGDTLHAQDSSEVTHMFFSSVPLLILKTGLFFEF